MCSTSVAILIYRTLAKMPFLKKWVSFLSHDPTFLSYRFLGNFLGILVNLFISYQLLKTIPSVASYYLIVKSTVIWVQLKLLCSFYINDSCTMNDKRSFICSSMDLKKDLVFWLWSLESNQSSWMVVVNLWGKRFKLHN